MPCPKGFGSNHMWLVDAQWLPSKYPLRSLTSCAMKDCYQMLPTSWFNIMDNRNYSPSLGLLHLPGQWWMEVQRIVFAGTVPHVSWCETRTAGSGYVVSTMLSKVKIGEDRVNDILENYLAGGVVYRLAYVAKKYMNFPA